MAIKKVLYLLRESEVLVSFARWRLSSALNVNPYLQEEYITEGIYRTPSIPFTATVLAMVVIDSMFGRRSEQFET